MVKRLYFLDLEHSNLDHAMQERDVILKQVKKLILLLVLVLDLVLPKP